MVVWDCRARLLSRCWRPRSAGTRAEDRGGPTDEIRFDGFRRGGPAARSLVATNATGANQALRVRDGVAKALRQFRNVDLAG